MRAQLELGNMVKTGQLGQLWEVACQTNLQFNLVRCVWPRGPSGPGTTAGSRSPTPAAAATASSLLAGGSCGLLCTVVAGAWLRVRRVETNLRGSCEEVPAGHPRRSPAPCCPASQQPRRLPARWGQVSRRCRRSGTARAWRRRNRSSRKPCRRSCLQRPGARQAAGGQNDVKDLTRA